MTRPSCPCCGQEVRDLPRLDELVVALGLTGDKKRLFTVLSAARGRFLSVPELVEIMWADREDGGPELSNRSIAALIFQLRTMLRNQHLEIEARFCRQSSVRLVMRWDICRPNGGWGYQLMKVAA